MYLLYFILWIIFNGQWTTEIALIGLVISALLYGFTYRFVGVTPRQEWRVIKRLPRILAYGGFLLAEIFKANFQVLRFIYSPRMEVEPELRTFHTKLKSEGGKVALANSITLTPGTITVHVKDDLFLVHCLDNTLADGLEDSEFERKLQRLEGDGE